MIFNAHYGRSPDVEIATVEELDAFLDKATATGDQYGIQIALGSIADEAERTFEDWRPVLQIGVGHPERSFLVWYGEPFGWACEPDLLALAETLVFNCGGEAEERSPSATRVGAETAREAARQFIRTGTRPANVEWFEPTNEDYYT